MMPILSPIRLAWLTLSTRPLGRASHCYPSSVGRAFSQSAREAVLKHTDNAHLELTQSSARRSEFIDAAIATILPLTPSVRSVTLLLGPTDSPLTFHAGQWCDLLIPLHSSQPVIGGFSIASAPHPLRSRSLLELVVKRTRAAPSHWLHHDARVSDTVKVRIAGDCFYDEINDRHRDIVLIGGGVGCAPLMSIARQRRHQASNSQLTPTVMTSLIQSVRSDAELLFSDELAAMAADEQFRFHYAIAVTGKKPVVTAAASMTESDQQHRWRSNAVNYSRRIDEALVAQHLEANSLIFLCGAPSMIDDWKLRLCAMGVSESNIRSERW